MQNNNHVENANGNQRPTSNGLEVKMYLVLFGFAAITLAIGFAWYDNQFRTWPQSQPFIWIMLQDHKLIYQVALLIFWIALYLIFDRLRAFLEAFL